MLTAARLGLRAELARDVLARDVLACDVLACDARPPARRPAWFKLPGSNCLVQTAWFKQPCAAMIRYRTRAALETKRKRRGCVY